MNPSKLKTSFYLLIFSTLLSGCVGLKFKPKKVDSFNNYVSSNKTSICDNIQDLKAKEVCKSRRYASYLKLQYTDYIEQLIQDRDKYNSSLFNTTVLLAAVEVANSTIHTDITKSLLAYGAYRAGQSTYTDIQFQGSLYLEAAKAAQCLYLHSDPLEKALSGKTLRSLKSNLKKLQDNLNYLDNNSLHTEQFISEKATNFGSFQKYKESVEKTILQANKAKETIDNAPHSLATYLDNITSGILARYMGKAPDINAILKQYKTSVENALNAESNDNTSIPANSSVEKANSNANLMLAQSPESLPEYHHVIAPFNQLNKAHHELKKLDLITYIKAGNSLTNCTATLTY